MKKDIILNELMIEVTRKCNMQCAHCLRGEAQNVNIHKEYIETLLKDVTQINLLTFTGGEPSLNIDAIKFTLETLKKYKIYVENFYMVVNGRKSCQKIEFLHLLVDMYAYQKDKYGELSMVEMSKDNFHFYEDEQNETKDLLSMFSFFRVRQYTFDEEKQNIIEQDRGADFYGRELEIDNNIDFEEYNNTINVETLLYLNARGNILNNCDMSYQTQRKNVLFSIKENSFKKELFKFLNIKTY